MPKLMKTLTAVSLAVAAVMTGLYIAYESEIYLTLAISFGTVFYHLGMRLLVGSIFGMTMKNRADLDKKWYRPRRWEQKLYKFLRVGRWKGKLPTYDPASFSTEEHSLNEIAQAMCQAELVHETIAVLSFLPLILIIWFGPFYVFLITSVLAAMFDLVFVIAQRYNRPRVLRLEKLAERRNAAKMSDPDKESDK